MTTKCAGMNCQSTDGTNHSPECRAEHAAAVAGGRFVKLSRGDANVPQTYAGFAAVHVNETGHTPSEQDAFDAGVRAGMARTTPSAPAVDAQSERETVPKWVFDGMTKTLEPAWNYIQTHQEQFGAMAGDDKTKIIVDEFVKHFASESVAIGALDEREAPAPGFIASAKTISAVSAALGAVREYANDRVADQMNRAVNLLLDELGQARAALSASTEAAAGKPIWPVPLTLDHSHVLAHCIELQFEDEEDADQFFSMYSAAMGNAAVKGEPVTLTHEELRFVELVRDNPGRKLNGGEAFGESGDALWKRLESLGLIECVGGYKWRLKIAPPSAASGQKQGEDK